MWERMDAIISLIVGVLMVLFSNRFAKSVFRFHSKRAINKPELERHLKQTEHATNRYTQVFVTIIGLVFVAFGLLLLLGVLKLKS